MKVSVTIAGAIFMLASLTACEFKSPADRVDEPIEDSNGDVFGSTTPQWGRTPAPPGRNVPPGASPAAVGPKSEPSQGPGSAVTPQSPRSEAKGGAVAAAAGAPASFTAVSAAVDHTCGVKTDGSLTCWGSNSDGQSMPPAGEFVYVNSGYRNTCGVKRDGLIVCWGYDGFDKKSTPPAGEFASVSTAYNHTCGVKTDGIVACWGGNRDGQATPPEGQFVSVSAAYNHTCGVMMVLTSWSGNTTRGPVRLRERRV